MSKMHTQEKQYTVMLDYRDKQGLESLGLMTSQAWYDDPKRLTFTLARYKFAAKMLAGSKNVLEVGCADAFATRIVKQEVEKLTAIDFDPLFVEDTLARMGDKWAFDCLVHDMLKGPIKDQFDGIYALDVLEHILPANESLFLGNIVSSLSENGVLVIGMPSLESQDYASPMSKEGHVNCKSMPDLKSTMQKYFNNVFMFSMNDEVIHTGYYKMAHYLFAIGCNKK
ncbi:bifunctional 2-polyprenyl-6-hydroxyphenol methylase/3-demethylubiquinol 3-O-methyltransferase UbiG [Polynucleobacter sp. IMCC 30228]|uniref:class I SAM-dependent methyltransferase n=1 Tax=Polynucleobacter sp. IMCC 30228 TaxID=2781011 RepID=UPI001F3552EE|nr:methyltransferase domain-containing protein [Polynucleobacter sp. IMCC 30228]MCE7527848.1 class I SAM-dependent methyltransferase [Polynucleobacter sp. IMCC 30228]